MGPPAIQIEDLGKRYLLGERPNYRALRDVISGAATGAARRLSGRGSQKAEREQRSSIWALRHVTLDVGQGEVLGVIGSNGAGKSTMLKVLSRITDPTEGRVLLRGRIGSLLEVGTGFHHELTGRENIFLNGSILGMTRSEIKRRFDEIVAFSEVERFLDTPVKHYSSGMYVRLAFAVAAHLELDILLVDEVLAVGDVAFQRKCMGKMDEVAAQGRTIVFISHNMTAIQQLCSRAVILEHGRLIMDGTPAEVIPPYLERSAQTQGEARWEGQEAPGNERVRLRAIRVRSDSGIAAEVPIDQEVAIEVEFDLLQEGQRGLAVNLYLLDSLGNTALSSVNTQAASLGDDDWFGQVHPPGRYRAVCTLPSDFLNDIRYFVTVHLVSMSSTAVEATAEHAISFMVLDTGTMRATQGTWHGLVRPRLLWQTEPLGEHRDELEASSRGGRGNTA